MIVPKARLPSPALWDEGFRLRDGALHFDARHTCELSFLSDASRMVRHARVICSDRTARLLRTKTAVQGLLPTPFGRTVNVGTLRLELFPSGRALGAAQVLVETKGARIVYCAGFSPHASLTAESYQVRPCDVLLLDCPYDEPGLVFPPPAQVRESVVEWVRATLATGGTPVLLASALGVGQELLKLLGDEGLPIRAHRSIYDLGKTFRELGVTLANGRPFRGTPVPGEVVLFPLHLASSPAIRKIRRVRIALVSGQALAPGGATRLHVDASFALSSHADHAALLAMVRVSGARQVVLSPRHGAAFEKILRRRGLRTTRFVVPEQLRLLA